MKRFIFAVILSFMLLFTAPNPGYADSHCASGEGGVIACVSGDGFLTVEVLGQEVIRTQITLPRTEVQVPVPTVVPGPTETATIRIPLPRETETIRVPNPVPGPTSTITQRVVVEGETVTITPEPRLERVPGPTRTVTVTPTVTPDAVPQPTGIPTRQPSVDDGTIVPEPPEQNNDVVIDLPDLSVPQAVGLGFLTILLLALAVLGGMYGGYIVGYKDSQKKDTNFMRALSDSLKLKSR